MKGEEGAPRGSAAAGATVVLVGGGRAPSRCSAAEAATLMVVLAGRGRQRGQPSSSPRHMLVTGNAHVRPYGVRCAGCVNREEFQCAGQGSTGRPEPRPERRPAIPVRPYWRCHHQLEVHWQRVARAPGQTTQSIDRVLRHNKDRYGRHRNGMGSKSFCYHKSC